MSGQNGKNHTTTVEFHAGAGGEVTPTCFVIKHFHTRIMHDCGITPGISSTPQIPENIDFVVLSHAHVDHIGGLLHFWMKNKCPVFAPEGAKQAMKIALMGTYKIQSQQGEMLSRYHENVRWLQDAKESLKNFIHLLAVESHESSHSMNRKGRKDESLPHHIKKQALEAGTREHSGKIEAANLHLQKILGIQGYDLENIEDIKALGETVKMVWIPPRGKKKNHGTEDTYRKDVLTEMINLKHTSRTLRLAEEEIQTPEDVEKCIINITELTLGKFHRIFSGKVGTERNKKQSVEVRFQNSGHTYSTVSATALYRLGGKYGKHILATGDLGNDKLPHPYPKIDPASFVEKVDMVISEGTYGGANHHDREVELERFDRIIVDAIQAGKDIVIPIISLDRPIFGMWEIVTRLLEKKSKIGKEANIKAGDLECLYLGNDLRQFLPKGTEVWKKIQRHFKPLETDRVSALGKKGKRSRVIFAAGGFGPPKSPAAGVLIHALQRPDTQVVFINYCGDADSNARRLLAGLPFEAFERDKTGEIRHELQLPRARSHIISAFSGHADQETIAGHVIKACKEGTKILINHSSDPARKELKRAFLRESHHTVDVVLPRLGEEYVVKKNPIKQ